MQQRGHVLVFQRRLGLGKARRDQPGLAGDRKRIEDGAFEKPLGAGDEVRRQPNLPA